MQEEKLICISKAAIISDVNKAQQNRNASFSLRQVGTSVVNLVLVHWGPNNEICDYARRRKTGLLKPFRPV